VHLICKFDSDICICFWRCIGGGLFLADGVMGYDEARERFGGSMMNNTALALADEEIYVLSSSSNCNRPGFYSMEGSTGKLWCNRCPPGLHKVDANATHCTVCDAARENCTLGGAAMLPTNFSWHSNDASLGCALSEVVR
jgi:hypothetical protein